MRRKILEIIAISLIAFAKLLGEIKLFKTAKYYMYILLITQTA